LGGEYRIDEQCEGGEYEAHGAKVITDDGLGELRITKYGKGESFCWLQGCHNLPHLQCAPLSCGEGLGVRPGVQE